MGGFFLDKFPPFRQRVSAYSAEEKLYFTAFALLDI